MSQYTPKSKAANVANAKVAIAAAEWNAHINEKLTASALRRLKEGGADVSVFKVPGAVELTFAANQLTATGLYDAIIVFGTVIRGGTPHFDYVCQSVTQGIATINATSDTPVIFGVLTVDNEQDALDRAGGPCGDKGEEAAEAALKMINFVRATE